MPLVELPNEVLHKITLFLSPSDLSALCAANTRFYHAIDIPAAYTFWFLKQAFGKRISQNPHQITYNVIQIERERKEITHFLFEPTSDILRFLWDLQNLFDCTIRWDEASGRVCSANFEDIFPALPDSNGSVRNFKQIINKLKQPDISFLIPVSSSVFDRIELLLKNRFDISVLLGCYIDFFDPDCIIAIFTKHI